MPLPLPARLQQLRAELESYSIGNLSVLYAIQRELLRYLHGLSNQHLTGCPPVLRDGLLRMQQRLQAPAPFPAPSAAAQLDMLLQAVALLERAARCQEDPLQGRSGQAA